MDSASCMTLFLLKSGDYAGMLRPLGGTHCGRLEIRLSGPDIQHRLFLSVLPCPSEQAEGRKQYKAWFPMNTGGQELLSTSSPSSGPLFLCP